MKGLGGDPPYITFKVQALQTLIPKSYPAGVSMNIEKDWKKNWKKVPALFADDELADLRKAIR